VTRETVLQAARTLLERDRAASLHDVASAAGVSRATVYRLFRSRDGLLQALDLEPDPDARQRALAAGLDLLDRDGLARLSMDEVAAAAGVSRASLYRLFPGKAALLRELLISFSPIEPIVEVVDRLRDRPPEEVIPVIARVAARSLAGRVGVLRTLLFEVSGASDEAAEGIHYMATRGIGTVARYVAEQMAAGRLRPVHPLLAIQSLAGPIMVHLVTRRAAERELDVGLSVEEAAVELAEQWLRAMRP
jgi:AcrR family transcriptional regulator